MGEEVTVTLTVSEFAPGDALGTLTAELVARMDIARKNGHSIVPASARITYDDARCLYTGTFRVFAGEGQ